MPKTLKILIFIILTTNLFLLVFSCAEKEEEQKEKCVFSDGDVSPNFKLIWMDTTIISGEYPEMDTVIIYCGNKSSDRIIEDLYYLGEDWVNDTESAVLDRNYVSHKKFITFWIEIEKNKNRMVDSFIAAAWVTDENCKDYQKTSVPFYKYKETDSSHIFTTQLIENREYIAGCPIFLTDNINLTNARDEFILLNAAGDYLSESDYIYKNLAIPIRRFNVEINVNFDATIKDTLKTFYYVFPVEY